MIWAYWSEDWLLYHKVTFDGENRLIIVNDGITELNVKEDIYSDWKEWFSLRDNAKFAPALRTIGGDSVGGGLYAGDMYFCINNWRIVINHDVFVNGIIYSDDYPSPFIVNAGGGVINRVSNLAYAYNTAGVEVPTAVDIRQEMDANSTKLTSILDRTNALPTATDIRTELTAELAHLMSLQNGLTTAQATMLTEIYRLYGLDPTKPLVVTKTARSAGAEIAQTIVSNDAQTTVTRQ